VLQFLLGSVEHVRLSNHLEVAALGVQRRPVVAEPFCVARILVGDAVLTLYSSTATVTLRVKLGQVVCFFGAGSTPRIKYSDRRTEEITLSPVGPRGGLEGGDLRGYRPGFAANAATKRRVNRTLRGTIQPHRGGVFTRSWVLNALLKIA
jgi:hypothetical protein